MRCSGECKETREFMDQCPFTLVNWGENAHSVTILISFQISVNLFLH